MLVSAVYSEGMKTFIPALGTPIHRPIYLSQIPAGFQSPADDYVEKTLSFDELVVKHPAATFFLKVVGSSMSPIILDGDIIAVDRSIEARHGHIVVASVNGEMLVKRLFKQGGIVSLLPENSDYSAIEVTTGFEFQIWGVVTYALGETCTA